MNHTLDKWEILLIRACKANITQEQLCNRFQYIWTKRCALSRNYNPIEVQGHVLNTLCVIISKQKNEKKSFYNILSEYLKNEYWDEYFNKKNEKSEQLKWLLHMACMISISKVDEWDNYVSKK